MGFGVWGLGAVDPRKLKDRESSIARRESACQPCPGEVEVCVKAIYIWGFPKIRGTFLGVPIFNDYSILGSILGYPNFGKLPYRDPGSQ